MVNRVYGLTSFRRGKTGGERPPKIDLLRDPLLATGSKSRFPLDFVWLLAASDAIGRSELGSMSVMAI